MANNEVTVHALNPDFQDAHPEAKYVNYIYSGADSVREHKVKANSGPVAGANPGRVSFNAKLNPNELLDRCVMVQYTLTVTLTGAAAGAAKTFAKTNGVCLASYPISRCCNNLNVKLNTYGESVVPWEFIGAYNHSYDSLDLRRMGSFPSQPDNFNTIDAMQYTGGPRLLLANNSFANEIVDGTVAIETQASPDSPFAGYQAAGYDVPRCTFAPINVDYRVPGGDAARLIFTYEVTEPLIHPFFRHTDTKSVLSRIQNMDVDMTFGSALPAFTIGAALCKNYNANATNTVLQNAVVSGIGFGPDAYLIYRTYVPNTIVRPILTARYNRLVTMQEPVPIQFAAGRPAGTSISMTTKQMVFSFVPEKLFIFARPTGQFTDSTSPEAFLAIEQLTIRTLNDAGCLSQATSAQLFQMSARNGLTMPYNKFARDIGSVIIVDLKRGDLGAHIPGTPGNFQIDMSLTLRNTQFVLPAATQSGSLFVNATPTVAPPNTDWTLYTIATVPSKLVLDGTSAYSSYGEDTADVIRAIGENPVHLVTDDSQGLGGKSGWQKFLHGIGSVLGLVRDGVGTIGAVRNALGRGLGDELGGMDSNYGMGVKTGGSVRSGGALRTLK